MTDDFFRSRLEQMIDNNHSLAVLASRLPWEKMAAGVAPQFAHKERPLKQSEEAPDLAGPVVRVCGGKVSNAGRPRLSMRLMIALTLLKNSFDLIDEDLVQRFTENVYWQHFAGFEYFDERRFAPNSARTRTNSTRCTHRRLNASIGKGKARKPYEFGVKVSVAVTHKQGLLVGARSFTGTPYDGHILSAQMEQSTILLQDLNVAPQQVVVDVGFRGKWVDQANPDLEIIHRGRLKTMPKAQRRWLKRRQAVEPAIGHLKSDNRMQRCWLQGATGDAWHALCCAVGYNLRWLMRAMVHLGLKGFLLCLFWLAYWARFAVKQLTQGVTVAGSQCLGARFAMSVRGSNR